MSTIEEISQELLSFAQSHPECIESLNEQLEILLADLQSMQTDDNASSEKVDYKDLEVWDILCTKFGGAPSHDQLSVVSRELSEMLRVPICRTLQRRTDLLVRWMNEYLGEVEQILTHHVVVMATDT